MIKGVSQNKLTFTAQNAVKKNNKENKFQLIGSSVAKYTDSFVKHSAKSTPILLSMTVLWSLIDNASSSVTIKKALAKNLKGFFLPVLIGSSALLTYLENKENKKTKNTEK